MHHTKMDYDQQRILQYIKGLLTDQAEQKNSETAQITLSCVFFFLMYEGGGLSAIEYLPVILRRTQRNPP